MADQSSGFLSPWLRRRRVKAVLPYLKGKVLDFGCGVGYLAQYCSSESYIGIDKDGESLSAARKTYPMYKFQSTLPVAEKFDTVIMLAVIEHINSVEDLLKDLSNVLIDDGRILITTPAPVADSIHAIGARIGLFSHIAYEEHEKLYDLSEMSKLIAHSGLSLRKYKRFLYGMNQLFVLSP